MRRVWGCSGLVRRVVAAAVTVSALSAVIVGSPTSAQEDYPPGAFSILLSASVVAPGASVTATVAFCELGVSVRVSVDGTSIQQVAPCQGPKQPQPPPRATATINAPTTPGQYTVQAGEVGGQERSATAQLTVSGPLQPAESPQTSGSSLPFTGSDFVAIVTYAAAAIVLGLGAVVVARRRRLSPR